MLIKLYGEAPEGQRRYSPAYCVGPEGGDHWSPGSRPRSNLTMRMHMRRFTRLTNAFSKKIENHAHAVALHVIFIRIHKTLKITPAMASGVTDRLWSMDDIVASIDARAEAPKRPSTYQRSSGSV